MSNLLIPVDGLRLSRKPYTPEKPKGAKAVTIAVGFLCNKGANLILAADRQITAQGAYKIRRKKYSLTQQGSLELTFFYSGEPGMFSEFTQKVEDFLKTQSEITSEVVQHTIESTLEIMKLRDPLFDPRFWLLAGISEFLSPPKLIVFDGKSVFAAKEGVHIIGCGDTSLINYLSYQLHRPELTVTQGIALGAYLIKKATQYVDGCGEPIDVIRGSDFGFDPVGDEEILGGIKAIEDQEEFLFTLLVQKPFQS
jgi:hypothetical protein